MTKVDAADHIGRLFRLTLHPLGRRRARQHGESRVPSGDVATGRVL